MGDNSASDISVSAEVAGLEAPIEIKIKTLDSQTYTLRVHKQMPVPELKQQIASVTGVLSEQQRLICRGRVLKDDQLLSAYHIEDGHTLHLVVGQSPPPSSSVTQSPAAESGTNGSTGQRIQVSPGVVVETYDISEGDVAIPELSRIVSAVLGAFGGRNSGGTERTPNSQPEQLNVSGESGASLRGGLGSGQISLGSFLQSRVIPDSLTTLTQYLDNMRQEYNASDGSQRTNSTQGQEERLPTPEMLSEVLLSAREFLTNETAQSLQQFGTELQNHSNITDQASRLEIQASAWRNGTLLQNLGAFLLELGRATMTLRMGSTSDAVVNAGPAVFISESGPNPLMVQPLPFQPGAPFGLANGGQPPSLNDAVAGAFVPRRIDIQIRRGSSSVIRESNNNTEEGREGSQIRTVPLRTMFAIPSGRLPGLNNRRAGGFQAFPSGPLQPESGAQQTTVDPVRQHTNATDPPPAIDIGSQPGSSRRFRFSVLSSGPAENHQPPGREVPTEVFQVLRSLFPGGEIHVEDLASSQPNTTTTAAVTSATAAALPPLLPAEGTTDNADGTSTHTEQVPERAATEDGIFLSNFLREIMPVISQVTDASTQTQDNNAGTSRRSSDDHENAPDSKRQKRE